MKKVVKKVFGIFCVLAVMLLCANSYGIELTNLLAESPDENVATLESNGTISLLDERPTGDIHFVAIAPFQSPSKVQAPFQAPLEKQVQAPSKFAAIGHERRFFLIPGRRARLENRADRGNLRAEAVLEGRHPGLEPAGASCAGGSCSGGVANDVRLVGITRQENAGNSCGGGSCGGGSCSGGRRGLFGRRG